MTEQDSSRVWFVTGASRGFGKLFTESALTVGDRVVATARKPEALADLAAAHEGKLVVLPLDVTDRDAVFATVEKAVAAFGRLDVVVNNAGHGLVGAVEEVAEAAAREIMDVNFFGALWVSQAVVPYLRAQGSGHIVQLSSVTGIMSVPTMGLYAATKFAMEGFSEALAQEVKGFGIDVTLFEPRMYATDFMGASMKMSEFKEEYGPVRQALMEKYAGGAPGDPAKVAEAMLTLVNSVEKPLRLLLGDGDFDVILDLYRGRIAEWQSWEKVSRAGG